MTEKIFYIMGKSASGKDSIYAALKDDEQLNLNHILLYTTRPIRNHEKDGVDYFFIDEEKVQQFQQEGKIIEMRSYNTVHGVWRYLTVDDGQFRQNGAGSLMIGTLESYEKMKQYFGADVLVPIYIEVEDGVRLERALQREKMQKYPKYSELCRRYLADEQDFCKENLDAAGISFSFHNDKFQYCVEQIREYIRKKIFQ
ncbi:MAG: guanylate kinase [Clostridiales bacterium]|nr:guanylate kinase [Clostridiales bacterium]